MDPLDRCHALLAWLRYALGIGSCALQTPIYLFQHVCFALLSTNRHAAATCQRAPSPALLRWVMEPDAHCTATCYSYRDSVPS
ncbi:hypothetical protein COCSADRAFT_266600 [Bipolaris sorokiniana ND90Pr]|uniref:Uncharacterized protein n=1 Tax=Cochliobolus sativus (strain ND90Pr / ATCC 201652) TaxID=665912 RepID=M2T008_COCSN|nr:uncharacterized protein COCSADRAFT_266600 [Bipolaris sorokiniana ND90Pr]EMD67900.1 hypothetical protein COCSADRAFT_266600 [Bipolaris sorokiniana ND90Pr]